jgi:hypothetical protein
MRTRGNFQQGAADAPYLTPIAPSIAELRGILFRDLFLIETGDRGLVAAEAGGFIAIWHGLVGTNHRRTHSDSVPSLAGGAAQNKTPATQKIRVLTGCVGPCASGGF